MTEATKRLALTASEQRQRMAAIRRAVRATADSAAVRFCEDATFNGDPVAACAVYVIRDADGKRGTAVDALRAAAERLNLMADNLEVSEC